MNISLGVFKELCLPLIKTALCVLGTNLVKKAIYAMVEGDCDEVSEWSCLGAGQCSTEHLYNCPAVILQILLLAV